jgi:hypothetical protein
MRPQITAYLHLDTKEWLARYATKLRLPRSEIVRLLVEREQQVRWLRWALPTPDPAMGESAGMPRREDRLPPRWNNPPKPARRTKRHKDRAG